MVISLLTCLVAMGCMGPTPARCEDSEACGAQPEVEPGVLLVTDRGTQTVTRWASGSGDPLGPFVTADSGPLYDPTSVAFRGDGAAFVVNFGRGHVLAYDGLSGSFQRVFFYDSFMLEEPVAIRFRNDHMFVLGNDTRNLLVLDSQGQVADEIGRRVIRYAHDFRFGPDGLAYIGTSWDPHRAGMVQVWDVDAGVLRGSFGTADELDEATGLAFGPDGLLYVSDVLGDRVICFDPTTGNKLHTFIGPEDGLRAPYALDFGAGGDLYVLSDRDVLRYDGVSGEPRGVFVSGDDAGFDYPRGMTWRYGGVAARWLDH